MKTVTKTLFTFDELSDSAKDTARNWYRSCIESDDFEYSIEDATQCAKIIGIEIDQNPVKLMGGGTRYEPTIYWSGFASQGDGACFEGRYSYVKGAAKAIRKHSPQDSELHSIADRLQALQRKAFYKLEARTKHRGRYYHSGYMSVDVYKDGNEIGGCIEDDLRDLMRRFAGWIYSQLSAQNDYLYSEENVDDAIGGNEYTFDENGNRED